VRPALLLAVVLALAAAACGASAAGGNPIRFGLGGGNIFGYRVTIRPNGSVRIRGRPRRTVRREIAPVRVRQLRLEIQHAHLASRECLGALPDLASRYVGVGGRTVTVHGACEAGFNRVWNDLAQAVGIRAG
jgi:hypothetical protein